MPRRCMRVPFGGKGEYSNNYSSASGSIGELTVSRVDWFTDVAVNTDKAGHFQRSKGSGPILRCA